MVTLATKQVNPCERDEKLSRKIGFYSYVPFNLRLLGRLEIGRLASNLKLRAEERDIELWICVVQDGSSN